MTTLEQMLKKLNIKAVNNIDVTEELCLASAIAVTENSSDKSSAIRAKYLFERLRNDLAPYDASPFVKKEIENRVDIIRETFVKLQNAYNNDDMELFSSEFDYLSVLGFNISEVASKLNESGELKIDDKKYKLNKIYSEMNTLKIFFDYFNIYLDNVYACMDKSTDLFYAINNLNAVINLGYNLCP